MATKKSEVDKWFEGLGRPIEKADWFPTHASLEFPDTLYAWINSINDNFLTRITYIPFEIYKRQAEEWMKDTDSMSDYEDYDDQVAFLKREFNRCRDNTLYFANKYGYIKEGEQDTGWTKYDAWEAQMIVMFLFDCHYSFMIGKPRQVGFTSTIVLCALKRINFNRNYFVKFITKSVEKAEEILRDKAKPSFSMIPDWLQQEALHDNKLELNLASRGTKGNLAGFNSRMGIGMPTEDAINGGSPNLTMVDEIGLFPLFPLMLAEARPALFYTDPKTKKISMKRQVVCWGTGYKMDEGGATFEAEFTATLNAWKEKFFAYGLIPLFFNAYARMGITDEEIQKEKRVAYSKVGPDRQEFIVKFHQAYPITIDDMFMRSSKTILPIDYLNKRILDIYRLPRDLKPKFGYFEPIYDLNRPQENLFFPYKLLGSRFVETNAMDDDQTTACIIVEPDNNWRKRFYKGTDPINSETGKSKFSSSIWDKKLKTVACCLFHRTDNPDDVFSQSILQGLYYFPHGDWKELIESNIGDGYVNFMGRHGYGRNIMANMTLPPIFQGGSAKWWGVSNKTNTADKIVTEIKNMYRAHAETIYVPWIFLQLKTFIEKDLKNPSNSSRVTRYQAAELKYDRDDAIFSSVYSYIAGELAYMNEVPEEIVAKEQEQTYKTKWVQNRETNFTRQLAQVDGNGNIIRLLGHRKIRR